MKEEISPIKRLKKEIIFVAGIWGLNLALVGSLWYHEKCIETEQFNPINQISVNGRHNELYEKIFGKWGYADTNKDGMLTFEEKAKAYRDLGYNEFFSDEQDFPGLIPISKLEKVVEKYKKLGEK